MGKASSSSSSSSSSGEKKKKRHKKDKKEKKKEKKEKKKAKKEKGEKRKDHARERDAEKGQEAAQEDAAPQGLPTRAVTLAPSAHGGAFGDARRPFGLELDGALVVDIADRAHAALAAGVSIGWLLWSVKGKRVPEEAEGAAAQLLREAEVSAAATEGATVEVRFVTEEPEHWKEALRNLKRGTEAAPSKKAKKEKASKQKDAADRPEQGCARPP
eukprot:TRINITY_DN19294_c0_g1_i1.p1 TRINITY_DN19294_c0_g1~~TRINITY_DN19294_c0_g1_i1.p1  ORF type:complete len:215 (+),score=68.57 TRINITY_DN19294_c0_g1_i1:45-689(+)